MLLAATKLRTDLISCLLGCRWGGQESTTHMKYIFTASMLFRSSLPSVYTAFSILVDTWNLSDQICPQMQYRMSQRQVHSGPQAQHLLASPCCLGARRTGLRSHQITFLSWYDELCYIPLAQKLHKANDCTLRMT